MLYNAAAEYLKKDLYPFHMPGHKRNASMLPRDLLSLDLTEIPGLDNLHSAEGVIRSAQERIASIYGADECMLSVNGSTAGIVAGVCSACREGETLLMARNSHISAFSGAVFSGARPEYIYPEDTAFGLCGGVNPVHVKRALEANPQCRAVFITSPTYEGFVSDIKAIAEIVHKFGIPLIVDEAHGAHFPFHGVFPEPAMRLGADIVITSPHKTLPALSQSALVLVKSGLADAERLKFFMRACQTSSPSYIIMSVIDYIYGFLSEHGDVFDTYANLLLSARSALAGLNGFRLISGDIVGKASVFALDLSKMLFVSQGDITGYELEKRLAGEFGVQLEMSAEHCALALTSPADTADGFDRLVKGIKAVDASVKGPAAPRRSMPIYDARVRVTPREAAFSPGEIVAVKDSLGRVSADFVCAYPPGVPVLAPGELITRGVMDALIGMRIHSVKIIKDFDDIDA